MPVLILTARDAIPDRIAGLDAGADDYLVKPVDLGELAARLRALVRRSAGRAAPVLTVGALDARPGGARGQRSAAAPSSSRRGSSRCSTSSLAPPGGVLSKDQLAERVYGCGEELESERDRGARPPPCDASSRPEVIVTVRGVGYLLPKELAVSRAPSLRRRLLGGVLAAVAIAWIAVSVAGYLRSRHELGGALRRAPRPVRRAAHRAALRRGTRRARARARSSAPPLRAKRRVPGLGARSAPAPALANAPNERLSQQEEGFSDSTVDGVAGGSSAPGPASAACSCRWASGRTRGKR